jgi:hypothetical protein
MRESCLFIGFESQASGARDFGVFGKELERMPPQAKKTFCRWRPAGAGNGGETTNEATASEG